MSAYEFWLADENNEGSNENLQEFLPASWL
jgi:hypothetical protein